MNNILLNMLWAAAVQWLFKNPFDPRWSDIKSMTRALGSMPDL